MVFLKEFFEKVDFDKKKKHAKFPSRQGGINYCKESCYRQFICLQVIMQILHDVFMCLLDCVSLHVSVCVCVCCHLAHVYGPWCEKTCLWGFGLTSSMTQTRLLSCKDQLRY